MHDLAVGDNRHFGGLVERGLVEGLPMVSLKLWVIHELLLHRKAAVVGVALAVTNHLTRHKVTKSGVAR